MKNHNEENKNQEKRQIDGNWVIAFFALMFVSIIILGKCEL